MAWIEMPVADRRLEDPSIRSLRPKYVLEGRALIVYRGNKAYVALGSETARDRFLQEPDVRTVTTSEATQLGLPGAGSELSKGMSADTNHRALRPVRLGDLIGQIARTVGLNECPGCRSRRKTLNRITVWRWWHSQ